MRLADCLDHEKSVIYSFYPDDYEDPVRAGKPRGVIRLMIDPTRLGGEQVFRVKDWKVPLIVSQAVRDAVEESAAIGVRFFPVTP